GSAGAAAEVSGIGVKGVEVDDGERGGEVLGVAVPWGSGQVVCRPLGERRVSAHAFEDLTKPIRYARNWSPRGRPSSTIGREGAPPEVSQRRPGGASGATGHAPPPLTRRRSALPGRSRNFPRPCSRRGKPGRTSRQ